MSGLKIIKDKEVINICPNDTEGEIIEIESLLIQLPKKPEKKNILFYNLKPKDQRWQRQALPKELNQIKSMDDWYESPREFQLRWGSYIEEEFRRRREGVWFYNNGIATYVTSHHYMFLQWSSIDIGYPSYLDFQRRLFIHFAACEADPRCLGQIYTKCRRSGYTNMSAATLVDEGSQVKDKLLGIMSKTGADAQEAVFGSKVIPIFKSYPFFFAPVIDGTTNPRMELAFREPSKRITKNNKTATRGEALDTIINWKNTVMNAYDGSKAHRLFFDEAGKYEKGIDIREIWRIHRTCLIVGRKVIGKAMIGSTVNPLDRGGREFRGLYHDSDPNQRNENGRTKSGLYKIFIPAYEALEGFFDQYGMPIIEDPTAPTITEDGTLTSIGARTFLKNERKGQQHNSYELNEIIRQFPFTEDEAFRDSTKASLFNITKIYEQIQYNDELFPNPVVIGNFCWEGGVQDTKVMFKPDPNGRWRITWMPPIELRNKTQVERNQKVAPNDFLGCGGVDSYDLDATTDGRASKGACHLMTKFNMQYPSNMFVAEYASRPPLAKIFYEDVLMASVFYGFPLLVENNKYGIVRYFESRGYDGYLMARPAHLSSTSAHVTVKTKGIPSNSQDVIQAHAQAIEAYIYHHVGSNDESGLFGKMYFNRTLEDWINFKIDDRTKFDLTISSGLALIAAQKVAPEKPKANFNDKVFFRKSREIRR
jgi:hypothetical protein